LNEEDFRGLNGILDEYGSELRAEHVGRWGELNTEFHTLMYRHAEQPRSLAIVANLLRECDRHTRLQLSLTGGMERAEREHRQLVDLCAEGKVREACALLKAHIDHVRKSLRDFLLSRQTM
jgi:DNA-binding GntR family transcriptional regulator